MMRFVLGLLVWLAVAAAVTTFAAPAFQSLQSRTAPTGTEQSLLVHAKRLVVGDPMYQAPYTQSLAPVMPGFPLAASVLGGRARPARAMSMAAVLIVALLLAAIVFDETGSRTAAAAGAAMLAFTGGVLAGPPGIAQADVVALVFVLAGFLAMRVLGEFVGSLVASLLFAAACFVHPLAVPFVVAALAHAWVRGPRALVGLVLGLAVFLATSYVLLSRMLGPWFNFAAWDGVVATFRFDGIALLQLASRDLLSLFGVLALAIVLSFALPVRPWQGAVGVWLWLALGALGAAALASQSTMFADRALLPLVTALALVGPIAMDRVVRHLSADRDAREWGGRSVLLAALLIQFFQLWMASPAAHALVR